MKKNAFTLFTFRRKGRNYNALQRKYWNGVGKPFTYAYKKKKPIKRQDGEEQNNGQRMNGESIKGNDDDLKGVV